MEKEVITVSVLTYNSSKTVLETLDSIKAQTYLYLNLNICDDCSTDETIKICEEWIKENRNRFQDVKIVSSFKNLGVAFNCNRSLDLCETKYLKEIAGDDILEKECISKFLRYAKSDIVPAIYFSKVKIIGDSSAVEKHSNLFDYKLLTLNPQEQLEFLTLKHNVIPAASAFYNVEKLRQIKLRNDERIPALEDWPKWINYLKKGGRFGFLDETLVGYRVGEGISTNIDLYNKHLTSTLKFELLYRTPAIITCDEKIIDSYVDKLLANLFFGNQVSDLRTQNTIMQSQISDLCSQNTIMQSQISDLRTQNMIIQNKVGELHKKNKKHLKVMQKMVYLSVGLLLIIFYLLSLII